MLKLYHACVPIALMAAPTASQTPAAPQAQTTPTAKASPDPNEVICEKQEVIGSRLSSRRICMTRAQWADRKLQDQQELTRVQTQRSGARGN